MLGLVNMMTGNAFSQMTIMAMGITPYINSSIIMQLLTIAIPALERLQKEGGEEGKAKINKITRYSTFPGRFAGNRHYRRPQHGQVDGQRVLLGLQQLLGHATIGVIMAGGTALAMWIGERITKNGIGNGISLLIFAGIISNLFNGLLTAFTEVLGITSYGTMVAVPHPRVDSPGHYHCGHLCGLWASGASRFSMPSALSAAKCTAASPRTSR